MKNKIFDCITFYQENFLANFRFEVLDEIVDYFVVCESLYDHRGNKKKLNFKLTNPKFKKKIIYLVFDKPFISKSPVKYSEHSSDLSQQKKNIYFVFI